MTKGGRGVGKPALLSDLLTVTFSSTNIFVKGEIVLVPRTKGGFTYGSVRKIVSRPQLCYMDKEVQHVYPEYKVFVDENSDTTKGLPACYIGRIDNDIAPSNDYPDQPSARELGGKPLASDLNTFWFGAPKAVPRAGEFVLVPRSKGGFCYGAVAKQVSGVMCPISDTPRHAAIAWRAFLEDGGDHQPLHKDLPAIFIGFLRNPYIDKPPPKPKAQMSSVAAVTGSKSRNLADVKCSNCQDALATLECANCGEYYCADCSDEVHEEGDKRLHTAITPIVRQKPQIVTSASTAGQQMISIGNKGKGPTPGFDLSSIFAPMPSDFVAPPMPQLALFPSSTSGYTPSPFLSPHLDDSDEDEKAAMKAPGAQKAIFPKRQTGSQNSSPSNSRVISNPSPLSSSFKHDDSDNENASDSDEDATPIQAQKTIFKKPDSPAGSNISAKSTSSKASGSALKTGTKNPVIVPVKLSFGDNDSEEEYEEDEEDEDEQSQLKPSKIPSGDGLAEIKTLKRAPRKNDPAITDIKTMKRESKQSNQPKPQKEDSGDGLSDIKTLKRPSKVPSSSSTSSSKPSPPVATNAAISNAVTLKRPAGPKIVPVKPMSFLDSDEEQEDDDDEEEYSD